MTAGQIIYKLLIGPLELFFEVVFVIANRLVDNPAYAIIMLSLAMNFLVLPLYRSADAMQAEERDRENKLAPWIKHIKKTFKGDERFMMLQAFYRQNNYKPTDSLKGSVSLFLEVPFFIAAYHFLSHLETIKGVSFGPIADLGAPDALISLGSASVNVLPILMTLINVCAAAIYMKGFPIKSKVQMYGIAVIFLVLLYNSPAGLVFYWTLNNLFSLVKNVFYKLKEPGKVLRILASLAGAAMLVFVVFIHPMRSVRSQLIVIAATLMLQLPLIMQLLKRKGHTLRLPVAEGSNTIYYGACALLTVLTGVLIPSAVVNGSAEEFIDIATYTSPVWYIVSAFILATGTFIIWFGIFYRLAGREAKQIMSLILSIAAFAGLMDYLFFGKNYGNFSADLQFDTAPTISSKAILINMVAIAMLALVIAVLWLKKRSLVSIVTILSCIALIGMSGLNMVGIAQELKDSKQLIKTAFNDSLEIKLSKTGKNVIVLMMDRQIGYFIPFIMNEREDVKKQFDGFTYYENTMSFGQKTNFGAPALYGGYDYTPDKLNERDDMLLEEKHNEALKVMPEIFDKAGYKITLCEPTYAGYSWIPDLTVFDDHPNWEKYLANHSFSLEEYGYKADNDSSAQSRYRNFFCYSIFKIAPTIFQTTLYEHGKYNEQRRDDVRYPQVTESYSKASGLNKKFMKTFAVLCHMPELTKTIDTGDNTFFMMSNDTTHETTILKEPEYEPAMTIDNTEFDNANPVRTDEEGNELPMKDKKTVAHYQMNMASMIKIGNWLDHLRKNGVYDNTRIIIVSDHGHNILNGDKYQENKLHYTGKDGDEVMNIMMFNSVLLVKDFDAKGFTTDETMTTNADVPAMATRGLIDNAENPFTKTKLTTYAEEAKELKVLNSHEWHINKNNGNKFLPSEWFSVNGDPLDVNSWKYIGWE